MGADSVPPNARAARQARINSDIAKLCSTRRPMWAHPSAQGIGLFTHVAGVKTVPKNPHASFCDQVDKEVALLPIGGPTKIAPSETREPPSKELAALYKELQDAVRAEEKIFDDQKAVAEERGKAPKGAYRMSLDTLKQKYGSVDDPPPATSIPSRPKDKRRHSEFAGSTTDEVAKKRRRTRSAPEVDLRRPSFSSVSSAGRDADAERRGSGSSANDYDVYRDPRRQRR
ncbi:hypothetical protein E8E12_004341 [Didymella heteroderae]|uniref:Uncharacterized protein n=1 Tax=Didymella heteroderae TaxID=1769908 RepID=A0A9P5BYQ5_9PLEO|nr:hypothetical protein E8E12_004341 [Didymella heteroderae]